VLHGTSLRLILSGDEVNRRTDTIFGRLACLGVIQFVKKAKKDGTNGLAVRAGRPVTQTTSSWKRRCEPFLQWNKYSIA
jgi:hypothetical protein